MSYWPAQRLFRSRRVPATVDLTRQRSTAGATGWRHARAPAVRQRSRALPSRASPPTDVAPQRQAHSRPFRSPNAVGRRFAFWCSPTRVSETDSIGLDSTVVGSTVVDLTEADSIGADSIGAALSESVRHGARPQPPHADALQHDRHRRAVCWNPSPPRVLFATTHHPQMQPSPPCQCKCSHILMRLPSETISGTHVS